MAYSLVCLAVFALSATPGTAKDNPVYQELTQKGIAMSDGTTFKLPPPLLPDGLDAAGQRAALAKADKRTTYERLVRADYYAPVVIKVRTPHAAEDDGPSIRSIDLWFVVRGDWNQLTSKEFMESVVEPKDEGKSRVVARSGVLTNDELAKRKLKAVVEKDREERFVYATFSLFDRVEISATRFAVAVRGKDSIVAAGKVDPRFAADADYPNQWRPLLRDALANIKPGPAHPLAHAGGYAKVTRLVDPSDAALIECHIVYEEAYGWFDGVNLVKQKLPAMVQERVRGFRRKLARAGEEKAEEKVTEKEKGKEKEKILVQ